MMMVVLVERKKRLDNRKKKYKKWTSIFPLEEILL